MQLYTNSIQDRYGNALKGAQITVRTEAGDIATLYSDNGVTLANNPLTADATGEFSFYAANGRYSFSIGATGMQSEIVSAFEMYDAIEVQAAVTAGAASAAEDALTAETNAGLTALDRSATGADRVQTGQDRTAAAGSATTASTQAGIATTKAGEALASKDAAGQSAIDANAIAVDLQANWGDKLATATSKAAESTASADASEASRQASGVNAGLAATAKTDAEIAKSGAIAAAESVGSFTTLALATAALAAIPADKGVYVTADGTNNGFYVKRSGVLVHESLATLPAVAVSVAALKAMFLNLLESEGVAAALTDSLGNAAWDVLDDGTVEIAALEVDVLNGITRPGLAALGALKTGDDEAASGMTDAQDNAAWLVNPDGSFETNALKTQTLNGYNIGSVLRNLAQYPRTYAAELVLFLNMGQSLGEGSTIGLTTAQEYDNIGFPALSTSPSAYLPLTVANTQATYSGQLRGESPMYGALGHIKALIEAEDGIAYTQQGFQLLACNNAIGGTTIAQLSKGTAAYNASLSQVVSAYAIAQAENRTFAVGGVFWTQGEGNIDTAQGVYTAAFLQLVADWNTDVKAAIPGHPDIHFFCYQTATVGPAIALAQLAAANTSPLIHMAAPMYQFDYYDQYHIDAFSSRALGGFYGLSFKRHGIDGLLRPPLQPVSSIRQGKFANIRFNNGDAFPLSFDTTRVPAQANYGFSLVDSGGSPLTTSSVSIIGPRDVKVVSNANIPAGSTLQIGFNSAVGKGTFIGGCTNLRNNRGDTLAYKNWPMHDWAVISSIALN